MSRQTKSLKNPLECPTCEKIPCACPAGGGGSDDENKKTKDENINSDISDKTKTLFQENENKFMLSAGHQSTPVTGAHDDLETQHNRPAWCTLFAAAGNKAVPMPSSNVQQDDSTNNTSSMSISMNMGMSMSA